MKLSSSKFNLYHTEQDVVKVNVFDHSCLYSFGYGFFNSWSNFIPYCIRPEVEETVNNENEVCYGEKMTFKELKLTNTSIINLFDWNADIELIDLYEKYLLLPTYIDDSELYCKCLSPSRLGRFCQYTINGIDLYDDSTDFHALLHTVFVEHRLIDDTLRNYSCYIGIPCTNHPVCLDWRDVCNGVVDCDNGEDEPLDLCLQLEVNVCNPNKEIRCDNGLCTTKQSRFDAPSNCLDGSDMQYLYENRSKHPPCSIFDSYYCEEFTNAWKRFSCSDGESISYSEITSKVSRGSNACSTKRDFIYLQRLFSSKNENQCWKSMMCLTGFAYLYPSIVCSNVLIELSLKQDCPNEFSFPENSVIYSFVFFVYEKVNRTNWFNYTGPDYICYNKKSCVNNISLVPTILKNNLTCMYVDRTTFSWMSFHDHVFYLFHSCFFNYQTPSIIADKMLYKCNLTNTFISIYRVKDWANDCFFHEDENPNNDICSLNSNDHFKCFTNENECIQQSLVGNGRDDCLDRSDEYIPIATYPMKLVFIESSIRKKIDIFKIYRFGELCDGIINPYLAFRNENETDETDCDQWPFTCDGPLTRCNHRWNCKNGRDEINCLDTTIATDLQRLFNCTKSEHYCLKLINNYNDIRLTCLNLNKAGDGIIDCVGGTDEQLTGICAEKYPYDTRKRFQCMNSSICIAATQVCDRIIDCPFEDDERVCPWLFQRNASVFACKNDGIQSNHRCRGATINKRTCPYGENRWFCDLDFNQLSSLMKSLTLLADYPVESALTTSHTFADINSHKLLQSDRKVSSSINNDVNNLWLCNQGYPLQSIGLKNKSYCLCSPAYYGDYCQYQSERLTVLISIEHQYYIDQKTTFRLIIYLLNANYSVISHDEIVYKYKISEPETFFLYLVYERMKATSLYQRSKSRYVRIDSYIIKEATVQYISSWLFNVAFPFLPVNRLKVILLLEDESLNIFNCKRKCGSHGKCMYYLNAKEKEYCWCKQGWFGDKCHLKTLSNLCNKTSCAPHSQCVILNDEKKQTKCICPLGKSGKQCYITYNSCFKAVCKNNGTCLSLDRRNLDYTCICTEGYKGDHCEKSIKYWYISIPANISFLSVIPATTLILCNSYGLGLTQKRTMYTSLSLPTVFKVASERIKFAFVEIFHNMSRSFYYMIAIPNSEVFPSNTSVASSNLCQNVSEIFNKTILLDYSYLKRLKLYHLPCHRNKHLRCFFDEYRMCFCTATRSSTCYLFDHEYSRCNYCQNNGACIRRDSLQFKWDYVCLCPECAFGDLCEFSTGNYFITLDMLIGIDVKTSHVLFTEQSFVVHLVLAIFILMLTLSLLSNITCIKIFSNKIVRNVGCDIYLFNLTIVSQSNIVLVLLRYIHMIINQIYVFENTNFAAISCKMLEYCVRLLPPIYDWITVCISIERAYIVVKDVHFTRMIARKSLKMSHWIISIVLVFNILITLHRPFYLILVDRPTVNGRTEGHPRCVLDFKSTSWNTYEKFINIFNLTVPIILNFASILIFIIYRTKFELATTIRKPKTSTLKILKQQLYKYKSVIISTTIIIILEIPRFIIAFALSCIEYDWQRYMYLAGYLISLLPFTSTLFIYILPSPKYKKQLKKILHRRLHIKFRS